jgi:uncharacterized Rossmann fold enzyme
MAGGCSGIGMESLQVNEGYSRLSIPPVNVDPPVSSNLISIQDDIRAHFGWGLAADLHSAKGLLAACEESYTAHSFWTREARLETRLRLQEKLISRPITVLGAAAEVEDVQAAIQEEHDLIAADGAVGVLTETEAPEVAWDALQCVVSDADGDPSHLRIAAERRIPFILHAHGDNISQWTSFLEVLNENNTPLILTHQTPESILGMHNPGGFTDGDRAVCMALSLNATPDQLTLRGFRTDIIGRWTGATVPERKMRKLEWMKRVLDIAGVKM